MELDNIDQESSCRSDVNYVLTSVTQKPSKYDDYLKFRSSGNENLLNFTEAIFPMFANRIARLNSFVNWNPNHSHKPDDLVKVGFFYAGYADCARCFYCGLGLKFWRPYDDATLEHIKLRPRCTYMKGLKGQAYIDLVINEVRRESRNAGQQQDDDNNSATNAENDDRFQRSIRQQDSARNVEQQQNIPRSTHDDDATGNANIDQLNSDNVEIGAAAAASNDGSFTDDESDTVVKLRVLGREYDYSKNRLYCMICGEKKNEVVNLPCGHIIFCKECSELKSICTVCEKHISATANIYIT